MKKLILSAALLLGVCLNTKAQSLNFDGQDDYIDAGTINLSSYTKEAWVYANASGSCNIISSNSAPFWIQAGKLSAANGFGGGGTIIVDPATFPLQVWTHVAVTYNASNNTLILYKNGVAVAQNSSEPAYIVEDIHVGEYGGSNNFDGNIDEVRIWSVARTQAEIQDNMNCSLTTKAGLVLNYTFSDGVANSDNTALTSVTDISGNSNNGQLNNFTLNGNVSNFADNVNTLNPVAYATINASATNFTSGTSVTFIATPVNGGSSPSYQWMKNNVNVGSTSDTYIDYTLKNKDTVTCMINSSINCVSKDSISNKIGVTVTNNLASLNFDGADDYVLINQPGTALDNLGLADFTLEAWVYSTDNSSVSSIVRKTGDYNLYLNNGILNAEVWPNGSSNPSFVHVVGSTNLSINQWYHVAFTWSNSNGAGSLYVNSVAEATSLNNNSVSASEPLQIGASDSYGQYFKGNIDEVKFWNVARSASEIAHDMNCTYVTGQAGLLASYNFNEGTPNGSNPDVYKLVDNSGNNNDGDLTNFSQAGTSSNWTDDSNMSNALPVVTVAGATAICVGQTTTLTANGATTYTWSANASSATTATVSLNASGAYTVTGANGACTTDKTVSVVVNSLPNITINGAHNINITVCTGTSGTLTAGGAVTYTWVPINSHSPVLANTISAPVHFTLTGTNANGCVNSTKLDVAVNPLPTVSINSTGNTLCAGDNVTLDASGATSYTWSANAGGVTTSSVNLTPNGTDTYTVTGKDANNCVNKAVQTVTVNQLPLVSVASQAICASSTATLTATGADTFTWSTTENTASITSTPTATTTDYTVTGTDASTNCSNMAVATVTVNQLPSVTFDVNPNMLCLTDPTVTLTASPAGGAYTGAGITADVFDPNAAGVGTYTLTYVYTDGNSCTNNDTAVVNVASCATGINNIAHTNVSLYPNPTENDLYIQINNTYDNATVEIYNAIGQKVMVEKLQNATTRINLNSLTNAVYEVRVINNNTVIYQSKVVKQQ